jgi:hypothetical protein
VSDITINEILDELRKPFHPSTVSWKPGNVKGERALAMPYADLRAYMNRLDEVCGSDWAVSYEPWGNDRIICRLTIMGVTRSSTGEANEQDEKNNLAGSVMEAMAFKRASAMFGLGRYLYNLPTGWADYDPKTRQFTDKAKARLTGILVQHYRRANDPSSPLPGGTAGIKGELPAIYADDQEQDKTPSSALFEQFNALGQDLYGDQWSQISRRNAKRISGGQTEDGGELTPEQIGKLIEGMMKLKSKRPTAQPAPAPKRTVDASTGEITDGDVLFAPDNVPTDEELEILGKWATPDDAFAWAVENGACNALEHAKNSLKALITKQFDGKFNTGNAAAVYVALLRHWQENISAPEPVAAAK